jgi:hypothetical protein
LPPLTAVIRLLLGATAIRTRSRHVIDAIHRVISERTIDDLLDRIPHGVHHTLIRS